MAADTSITIPNTSPINKMICTDSLCIEDLDNDVLVCVKCDRKIHFRCSRLPAYQIYLFNTKRHLKYSCQNCVGEIPKQFLELVPNRNRSQPSIKITKELEKLRKEVKTSKEIIKSKQNIENELLNVIEKQEAELRMLKKDLQNDPAYHTLEYVEKKVEAQLKEFQESIKTTIAKECKDAFKSYANAVQSSSSKSLELRTEVSSFKNALKDLRREEKAEEVDKQKRANNVIIHGVEELGGIDKDKQWVEELIKKLRVRVNIIRLSRIGKAEDGKRRPILVNLKEEDEKTKLFGNIQSLKGQSTYKGISINEDLSPFQRSEYKILLDQAKELNVGRDEYIWRVRGNSKNGFFLKKLKRTTEN